MLKIQTGRGLWHADLRIFEELPSTNQWALTHLDTLRHGDVVQAVQQTAGRGRLGRTWLSPGNRCLTLSVAMKPPSEAPGWLAVAQIAALAIRTSLAHHGIAAQLKWPNDVMAPDRKISGVLAERDPGTGSLVLGIGLNVNVTQEELAQAEISQPATSMAIAAGRTVDPDAVRNDLLQRLEEELDAMDPPGPTGPGASRLAREWSRHDYLAGKRIQVRTTDAVLCGRYAGLAPDGRLRLVHGSGQESRFWSGDVSVESTPGPAP